MERIERKRVGGAWRKHGQYGEYFSISFNADAFRELGDINNYWFNMGENQNKQKQGHPDMVITATMKTQEQIEKDRARQAQYREQRQTRPEQGYQEQKEFQNQSRRGYSSQPQERQNKDYRRNNFAPSNDNDPDMGF